MTYSLHPGAEQDVAGALNFYNEQAGPVVAARFLEEFERVARLLVEYPASARQRREDEESSR
jgi:toxin ParE1/3/4